MQSKILVISAPSGGGKSIVSNHILSRFPQFEFSISSTTRATRPQEIHGKHYYFITQLAFKQKITSDEFIEYEEIFGNYYGTLKSEIERITAANKIPLFDIDVKGAYSIKRHYPWSTLIFLKPPSIEVLRSRLARRATETDEQLERRLARAEMEISMCENFDHILINDELNDLLRKIEKIVSTLLLV